MSVWEREFTLKQVLAWGATRAFPERQVRLWFGGRSAVTIHAALHTEDVPLAVVYWAVMREQLLPQALLHRLAVRLATQVLDRFGQAGTAVDPRTRAVLAAKSAWLEGRISLGELLRIKREAERVHRDLLSSGNERGSAASQAVLVAALEDARDAFRRCYDEHARWFSMDEDRRALQALVLAEMTAWEGGR